MSRVKIVHFADLHLDSGFAWVGADGAAARRRRQSLRDSLDRITARVDRLDRTLERTIAVLERAEERIHRNVAPVLRATVLEWLPRVTGERYTNCKVDPELSRPSPGRRAGWELAPQNAAKRSSGA